MTFIGQGKNVLISELNAIPQRTYVPYVWGILRTYIHHHFPQLNESFHWLDPLFDSTSAREAVDTYASTPIDVLGLSCYTWNWDRQCSIARLVKEKNSDCLVVAGGPHPDYHSESFFDEHPYIDLVVVNDGEIAFAKILEAVERGGHDFEQIPGVVVCGPDGKPRMAVPPIKPTNFQHSPYLQYAEFYERVIRERPNGCCIAWETNRGCPYKCSFCDWGSNTLSKIRQFDMDRVRAEAEWIFKQPIVIAFLTDANFGILSRDLEIAEILAELRTKHRGPSVFTYSPAKNDPERTVAIAKRFARAGLATIHYLAIQHTHPDVLAATERANISIEKQKEVVRDLLIEGVPLTVQLILGIPGDTVEKWAQVFADLMTWGVHEDYMVAEYAMLPNAPAADPEFRAKWKYKTVRRFSRNFGLQRRKGEDHDRFHVDLIVECRTFTRQDWVRMRIYSSFIIALHNSGYTRRIAQYLRFSHGVLYGDFYDSVVNDFCEKKLFSGDWWRAVEDNLNAYLVDENVSDELELEEIPSLPEYLRHADWLMVKTGLNCNGFFKQLESYLVWKYPSASNLKSVIAYQKNLVITPDYDCAQGKRFSCDLNWAAYFREVDESAPYRPLPEPEMIRPGQFFEIRDDATGEHKHASLKWTTGDSEQRMRLWAECISPGRKSAACQCFDEPQLVWGEPDETPPTETLATFDGGRAAVGSR